MRQKSLSNLLTFTRASTGTYVNSDGLIASAATNAARIEYDPITLAVRGLLIEDARTNYLRFSQSFENTSPTVWTARARPCGRSPIRRPSRQT